MIKNPLEQFIPSLKERVFLLNHNKDVPLTRIFSRSVLAGFLIGVADYIYINSQDRIVAAFLFPLALICIIKSGAYLYTGKIGSVKKSPESIADMLMILIGNMIGLMILLFVPPTEVFETFVISKMAVDPQNVIIKGFFCGVLMYLAVSYTDGGKNFLVTILCVAAFLIGGCEHSIADLGYIYLSKIATLEAFVFFIYVLVGNTIGAITMRFLISLPEVEIEYT